MKWLGNLDDKGGSVFKSREENMTDSLPKKNVDVAKVYPGPILLLAGPGTGKTHQLARRIKYLIEEKKVNPDEITVISFTGEAARNMRERLCDEKNEDVYLHPDSQPKQIRTIHSLGHMIISEKNRKVGLRKDFTLIKGEIRELLYKDAAQISNFSREDADISEECRRKGNCKKIDEKKCTICQQYKNLLRGLNAIDYDDQIFLACELLKKDQEILEKYRSKAKYLLVDEYQDINKAQFDLIRILGEGQEEGLFVVGDDDQSIYSWRGGSPSFIMNFEHNYGNNAKIFFLDECRRCTPDILEAALEVVAKDNNRRLQKPNLHSIKDKGSKVFVYNVPSDKYEAKIMASMIKEALTTKDVLVLIPYNRFSAPIKREMRKLRIGYDCKTDVAKSGLNIINDLIKWLKNEKDDFSLRLCIERIISNPNLKIPFEKFPSIKQKREATLKQISLLWNMVVSEKISLSVALEKEAIHRDDLKYIFDLLLKLKNAWNDKERPERLMEVATRVVRPWTSTNKMADEIEEWVEDSFARNVSSGGTMARVTTMESAKGLGMDMVFVVGLNEGVFPPSNLTVDDLLEKQRLFYVSMTRAKKELLLFSTRTREGAISFMPSPDGESTGVLQPSPFLFWLPEGNIEKKDIWPKQKSKVSK